MRESRAATLSDDQTAVDSGIRFDQGVVRKEAEQREKQNQRSGDLQYSSGHCFFMSPFSVSQYGGPIYHPELSIDNASLGVGVSMLIGTE